MRITFLLLFLSNLIHVNLTIDYKHNFANMQQQLDRQEKDIKILIQHLHNLHFQINSLTKEKTSGLPGSQRSHAISEPNEGQNKWGNSGLALEIERQGLRGVKGDNGQIGIPGTKGDPGYPGKRGNPGITGFKGEKGEPGIAGMVGGAGKPGNHGMKGATGADGKPGIPGFPGKKGDTGLGIPGQSGLPGQRGSPGSPGLIGPQGLPGPLGGVGFQGVPGLPGSKGKAGRDGIPGLPNWIINDKGYCILSLGNCPPGFSQIQAYQKNINDYRFGEYAIIKVHNDNNHQKFTMEVHACCR